MTRASISKAFPNKPEEAMPELFEKAQGVPLEKLPPEIQKMFVSNFQKQIDKKYNVR